MNKKFIKEILMITLGTVLAAAGFKIFLVPNMIAAGGVSGVATILYYLFKLPIGLVIIVLNIPLFILGIKFMGKAFAMKTLYSLALYSALAEVIDVRGIEGDMFIAAVYGGILVGVGLGLVIKADATTGGTDMAAKILNHRFKNIGVSAFVFFVDFFVIFASGVFFSPVSALYAIASLYISTKMMELLLEGLHKAKAFFIITEKSEEVSQMILTKLERGVTLLYGRGMYTGERRDVLLCIVERLSEVENIKKEVRALDERAFVIAADIKEVLGEGFSKD
jgi:uncharacterized membrane-anchored protein YitT (DUF2179 family)